MGNLTKFQCARYYFRLCLVNKGAEQLIKLTVDQIEVALAAGEGAAQRRCALAHSTPVLVSTARQADDIQADLVFADCVCVTERSDFGLHKASDAYFSVFKSSATCDNLPRQGWT